MQSLVFATADISEHFSRVSFPVDYLDCLFSSDCLLPAFVTLTAFWIFSLSAASPDRCIDPVYESALPTLLLLLVIELYLSDLLLLLIKLHMDLNVTDPTLQKTLPDVDQAVFYHFTTEVSAQATLLATQQQQLNYLTSLTEELVRSMQALRLPAPRVNVPSHHPPRDASATASTTASPRLAFPGKFDGSPTRCKGFLLQCSMFIGQQPTLYPTDDSSVLY